MLPGANHHIILKCSSKSSGDSQSLATTLQATKTKHSAFALKMQLQDKSTVFHPEPPPKPHLPCVLRRELFESNITLLLE